MTIANSSPHVHRTELLWPDSGNGHQPTDAESLRDSGLIRTHGLIPIAYNERIKALARQQGRTADVLIGELIVRSADEVERLELEQEAAKLRERLGDNWLERLASAERAKA